MKRERFEQRIFRVFAQAGYSPVRILTITPEEMVEIPGIQFQISVRFYMCRIRCWQRKIRYERGNW